MSESLVCRVRDCGDLVTDAGSFLNAQITVGVYRHQVDFVSARERDHAQLFRGGHWSAEVVEHSIDDERMRYFLGFARKHYAEIITIGRFGVGVIEWFGVERDLKIAPGDVVDGELKFNCREQYDCKMRISGIGCVRLYGDMQHVPEEGRALA